MHHATCDVYHAGLFAVTEWIAPDLTVPEREQALLERTAVELTDVSHLSPAEARPINADVILRECVPVFAAMPAVRGDKVQNFFHHFLDAAQMSVLKKDAEVEVSALVACFCKRRHTVSLIYFGMTN
tara:strand:- start:7 stop:387 length:381 start_codon:yes stop_codon:yes gene_type:complete